MKFIIFCPDHFTGGPAALLQLHGAICDLGRDSEVFFYDKAAIQIDDNTGRVAVNYASEIKIKLDGVDHKRAFGFDREDVLIFPEALIELASKFATLGFAKRVIWWLSYDNAPLKIISRFNHALHLSNSAHIFQSAYARVSAQRLGFDGPIVSDYTLLDGDREERFRAKSNDLCYLVSKAPGADQIISMLARRYSVIPIADMTPSEVRDTLRSSRIFLDFGSQPGKDRVPREAVVNDCIPLVRKIGSAQHFDDLPLPEALKLQTQQMAEIPFLTQKIDYLKENSPAILAGLEFYKRKVLREKEQFYREVEFFLETEIFSALWKR
jgi:hypothetical protein